MTGNPPDPGTAPTDDPPTLVSGLGEFTQRYLVHSIRDYGDALGEVLERYSHGQRHRTGEGCCRGNVEDASGGAESHTHGEPLGYVVEGDRQNQQCGSLPVGSNTFGLIRSE